MALCVEVSTWLYAVTGNRVRQWVAGGVSLCLYKRGSRMYRVMVDKTLESWRASSRYPMWKDNKSYKIGSYALSS